MPIIVRSRTVRRRVAAVTALILAAVGVQAGVREAASASGGRAAAVASAALARPASSVPAADAGMRTRAGATARALSAARSSGGATEITADRTPFSRTSANPDGSLTTTTSVQPRWVDRGSSWVTADATLVQGSDGSWAPQAALGGLTLSAGGGNVLATARDRDRWLSVSWPQALPVPQVSGATATYPGVFPGVDLAVTAQLTGGFTETLVIRDKAAAADPQLQGLTLGMAASPGLSAHAGADGSLAEKTASGELVFYSAPPAAWDSSAPGATAAGPGPRGAAGTGAGLVPVPAAYSAGSVRLSVPASLLSGPASSFPVYVDPSYSQGPIWQNYGDIQSAYPSTNELGATYDGNVSAGYDGGGIDRGEYVFGLPSPAASSGVTIVSATMTATADKTFTSASTSHTINASYVTQYTSASTWNSPPTLIAGPSAQTFTTASTTPSVPVSWNVASWLQSAANSGAFQMTVQLANTDETDSGPFVEFGPNPVLSFTYTQPAPSVPAGTGPAHNATFLSFPISDKASLRVNVGSGNALFTTSDLTLPEAGSALVLGADYNSLLTSTAVNTGADRNGWRQRQGVDVRLYLGAGASGTITLLGPDGTSGAFTYPGSGTVYTSPAVFHATLTTTITSPCTGSAYQLAWHATGQEMCFNTNGLLTSQDDRNGNTTAFSYNASGQETQVAYTPRGASGPTETVNPSYTGSYLTGLTESGGSTGTKTVTYGINGSGDLNSIKQPDGTTLTLGYDGSHNLNYIQNGAGTGATLTYDSAGRVTSVSQLYGSSSATATTRLSYVSATETQVAAPNTNQGQPVSSVPNTTYTISSQALVTKATDPAGNSQTTSYNPVNNVSTTTNALGGVTASTYGSNINESLTSSAAPGGATATATFMNAKTGADPTAQYLPSTSTDAQANKTTYTYDGAGNLSQASSAMAAAAKVTPNTDGTPATSTDPGGGVTAYSWNSLQQLTKVTPPASGTLLPVTLTYDGFGRVATVTDGNGNTVTYTYDLADRITKQAYTGGPHTLTVTYAYDGAGNLHTQGDASGTTTWTYDGRNQVLTKNAASGGGTLTWGYDADGNMTSSADAAGTTTYAYNTRDLLNSLTDPTGKVWDFVYNAAGQRIYTYYNANAGHTTWSADQATGYDTSGRITSIQAYGNSGATTLSNTSYCYNSAFTGSPCPTAASTDTSLVQGSWNPGNAYASGDTYDAGNHLQQVTNDNGVNYYYSYDNDANLYSISVNGSYTCLTHNTSNQVTSSGYSYDHAGNLTADPANGTLAYNDAGQLTSASAAAGGGGSSGAETFTYAGASQQQPLSDGSATAITYGLAGQYGQPAVDSYATAGVTDYVIRDQQGDPLGMIRNGSSYMFLTDNIGTVTAITGTCACNTATYAYSPYGIITAKTGSIANSNLIGYTGTFADTYTTGSTGYVHDGNRWYNTTTGAFTTQDTSSYLASPANGNRYAYAASNPANYTDPTGQGIYTCVEAAGLGIGGGLLGLASGFFGIVTAETGVGAAIGFAGYLVGDGGFVTGLNDIVNNRACD